MNNYTGLSWSQFQCLAETNNESKNGSEKSSSLEGKKCGGLILLLAGHCSLFLIIIRVFKKYLVKSLSFINVCPLVIKKQMEDSSWDKCKTY